MWFINCTVVSALYVASASTVFIVHWVREFGGGHDHSDLKNFMEDVRFKFSIFRICVGFR